MSTQEYDFFATGSSGDHKPDSEASTTAPPVSPAVAVGRPGADPSWGAPDRPGQFGHAVDPAGRPVNQFGTPVGAVSAPTGPSAAPGYGAVASAVAQTPWEAAAVPTQSLAYGTPEMPTAPLNPAFASSGFGAPYLSPPLAGSAAESVRPGTVLAAGVIAIIQGAMTFFAAILGLLSLAALRGQLDDTVAGSSLINGITGILQTILLIVLALALVFLAAGIATVTGRRWGAWTLLGIEGVGAVFALWSISSGGSHASSTMSSSWPGLLVAGAVIVLLVVPASWGWLTRKTRG